jgi:hypothetical protein
MDLSPALTEFVTERHLAVLATQRADGTPHAVPVGFTFADGIVRVITFAPSVKAANARRGGRASVTQIDGARWVTFEGSGHRARRPRVGGERSGGLRAALPSAQGTRPTVWSCEIEVDRVMCNRALK